MKNKKVLMLIVISFLMCVVFNSNVMGAADNVKKIRKSVVIPEKVKVPVLKTHHIYMISQDLTPGYTLEVTGKNMGAQTFNSKFIVGGYIAEVLGWDKDFILLKFPDSPTLGKKIKSYIKRGNVIVSNEKEHTLSAVTGAMIPNSVFVKYNSITKIVFEAAWCGNNKDGMSLRFRKVTPPALIKPIYTKVMSITNGSGDFNNINAILPPSLGVGTYLVDLIQSGRVASGPPVQFKVKKLLLMKEKLNIK